MLERMVCDFQRGTGWRASKSNNRGSMSTAYEYNAPFIITLFSLGSHHERYNEVAAYIFILSTTVSESVCRV